MIDYARINGVTTQIDRQPVWQRNLRSEREYGQIKVKSDRRERYEMYQLVELVQEDTTIEQYLVQSDQAREVAPNYYEHTISLIEVMAIFDVIIPASRSFRTRTGQQLTIRDVLDVYIREIEYYHGYSMDYEFGAWLDKKLTQKEYDGQSMSSILTNLFNAVRSNPKCYVENGTYVLYPQPFSYRNTLIDPQGDTFYYEQNSMDYATKAKVQAKNAVYEDLEYAWYPSKDGYVLPRSEGFVVSPNRAQYEIDSNALGYNKVLAKATAATSLQTAEIDIDITDHVLTEEEFDALIDNGEVNKNLNINKYNAVKYDLRDNKIYQLESSGSWWIFEKQIYHLQNAIEYEWLKNKTEYEAQLPAIQEGENWGIIPPDTVDTPLRVQYIRQRDVDYTVNRMNSKGMTPSTMLYSQAASTIDLAAQKENMALMANRLGNNTEFVTNFFDEGEYIWQVGDYTAEGKVIVEAKYTEHHNGTYGEFELAENFANIKGEESITRDPSPYTITGKAVTTNVVEENYIVFAETQKDNDTLLTDNGVSAVRDTFAETPDERRRIDYAVYKRPDQTPLHMSIMSGGSGLTSTFHVQWRRPIIAGWYLDEVDNATIKQPTIYTSLGPEFYLQNYRLYHTSGGTITDTGDYPIIEETAEITGNALTQELFRPIDLGLNDSFAHTLALHATTSSDNINVGYRFSELLALHNSSTRSFKLWKSDTPYTMSDQEPRSTDTLVAGGTITHTRSVQRIEVSGTETFDYWAITDSNNNIIVSANNIQMIYYSIQERDIGAGQEFYIEVKQVSFSTALGIQSSMTYDTIILRKIDVAFTTTMGINSTPQFEYRKLNSLEIPLTTTMGINSTVSYTTSKPNYVNVAYTTTMGINSVMAYDTDKPNHVSESYVTSIGINSTIALNIGRPKYLDVSFATTMGINSNMTATIDNGEYTVTVDSTEGGTATGGGNYFVGNSVTVEAFPDSGYEFYDWDIYGNVPYSTANPYTFTMPEEDVTLIARFNKL